MKRNPFVLPLAVLYLLAANAWIVIRTRPLLCLIAVPIILFVNVFTGGFRFKKISDRKLRLEYHGAKCLFIFLICCFFSAGFQTYLVFRLLHRDNVTLIISIVWCFVSLSILFWNGIISVYLTSVQLGIRTRVIGLIFGWIFPVNLIVLCVILNKCYREVSFETEKNLLNAARADQKICRTKYPILLVHGVFFRDFKLLNYWGRIPQELKENGATVYYGEHQSALSVKDSAEELKTRIKRIIAETGCGKVNIIAHSKGGLDCRMAISTGAEPYVASLTTVNTPHRGCEFADYLLKKVPKKIQNKVEVGYNKAAAIAGDTSPDFMAAVRDLTAEGCSTLNAEMKDPETVFCQSIGSKLKHARNGQFPLNFSYLLVKAFDGDNDGLVGEKSFRWGEKFTYLTPEKKRGISHGDMIDLNRENIPGFDVREFYVQLVSDLRERGL